jgi:hypothetical protein
MPSFLRKKITCYCTFHQTKKDQDTTFGIYWKRGALDAFFKQQGRKTMPETPRRPALACPLEPELSGIYAAIGRKGGCAPHLELVQWSLPLFLKAGRGIFSIIGKTVNIPDPFFN